MLGPAWSLGCMMKAQRLGCLLWLLCMPTEVTLSVWKGTAHQSPSSISHVTVNSSFEIMCTTSLENPLGVDLLRRFHDKKKILYLSLSNGLISKTTTAKEFTNRIVITPDRQDLSFGFKVKLSQLGLDDTDLYYCHWHSYKLSAKSNGTVILVTDRGPQSPCKDTVDFTLIFLSVAAFAVTLFILIGALVWKSSRFKKKFIPAKPLRPSRGPRRPLPPVPPRPHRVPRPARPDRSQHICLQQQIHQDWPYITTATDPYGFENIR